MASKLNLLGMIVLFVLVSTSAHTEVSVGRRLQDLLHLHQASIYDCVQRAPVAPRGEVLVRMVADAHGGVARAEILKSSVGSEPLGECLLQATRKWDIRSLGIEPGDQVVFPLAFQPNGDSASVQLKAVKLTVGQSHVLPKAAHGVVILTGTAKIAAQLLIADDVLWSVETQGEQRLEATSAETSFLLVEPKAQTAMLPVSQLPLVVHCGAVKSWPLSGSRGSARLCLDGYKLPVAIDLLVAEAGTRTAPHVHERSDEFVYLRSGRVATSIGADRIVSKTGETVTIPMGVEHSIEVEETFSAVQIYAPAGPEQRFKNAKP